MAEFCNKCADQLWGDRLSADIDVVKIFKKLKTNSYISGYLCEGCGLVGIGKNKENKLIIAHLDDYEWVECDIEEFNINKNKRVKLCQKSGK